MSRVLEFQRPCQRSIRDLRQVWGVLCPVWPAALQLPVNYLRERGLAAGSNGPVPPPVLESACTCAGFGLGFEALSRTAQNELGGHQV